MVVIIDEEKGLVRALLGIVLIVVGLGIITLSSKHGALGAIPFVAGFFLFVWGLLTDTVTESQQPRRTELDSRDDGG